MKELKNRIKQLEYTVDRLVSINKEERKVTKFWKEKYYSMVSENIDQKCHSAKRRSLADMLKAIAEELERL